MRIFAGSEPNPENSFKDKRESVFDLLAVPLMAPIVFLFAVLTFFAQVTAAGPDCPDCKRPLYYDGCAMDRIPCGDFAGFQLVCNTDDYDHGQCRCNGQDKGCIEAVKSKSLAAVKNKLPQYAVNCDKNGNTGCHGSGHLCNDGHKMCKSCAEPLHCIPSTSVDASYTQCHTCSSCRQQPHLFDCTAICADA